MFLRKSRLEPLPITMTGVRMGERLLQIGIDHPGTVTALAKKVGLSGVSVSILSSESDADRARAAAAEAGVLIDVHVGPSAMLQFPTESFDAVVVHAAHGFLASGAPNERVAWLQGAHRVLRTGGRAIVIETAPRGGLGSVFRRRSVNEHYASGGGAEGALRAEGFKSVRVLGEVEGYRFTEGLKT